jgi:hypothetical protein
MASVISLDRSLELKRSVEEGTSIEVAIAVDADGDLIVSGHDSGEAVSNLFGSPTYDHWVVVGEEDKDLVLLHLLRERFADARAASAEFLAWLQGREIPHEVGSVAGEHRGRARHPAHGRRRNAARRTNQTRAGP